jgi:dolichyl-phosphate-mannose-protein mannosyltransferase
MHGATITSAPEIDGGREAVAGLAGKTPSTADGPLGLASIAAFVACAAAVFRIALAIPLHLPLNYNEGWNAYHALEVARGDPLYPSAPRFFFNNYPPLSFYLSAAGMHLVGDPIIAGRWLSLVAFGLWTFLLARVARALGCRRVISVFGALLFAVNTLAFTDYVGIDDPEFVAHVVAAVGLLAVVRRPRTAARACAGGLLLTLALFVKHNLVALPLACLVWLAIFDPRAAWRVLVTGAAAGAVGCAACVWVFGRGFFEQLASPRVVVAARAAGKSILWLGRTIVPVSTAVVLARRSFRDEAVAFCTLYAGLAVLAGVVFVGGEGVNANVFFDATWAVCLASAVALERLPAPAAGPLRTRDMLAIACLLPPALALVVTASPAWLGPNYWLQPRRAAATVAADDISFIGAQAGPALCEELALCFWAGKAVEVDVFNVQQRIQTGRQRPQDLVRLLEGRHFAVVQLDVPGRPLGTAFDEALARNYRTAREHDGRRLLVPR